MPKKVLVVLTNHERYPDSDDKTGLWLGELVHFYDVLQEAGYEMDFVSPAGGEVPLDPLSLNRLFTDGMVRDYLEDESFMSRLQATLTPDQVQPADYAAIYFTGGHGTMWDFPESKPLQELSRRIYERGGAVSSVCHGAAALLEVKLTDGSYLIEGKRLTGYSNLEELVALRRNQVPFLLETELKKRGADYRKGWLPLTSYALVDGRLVTGQNPNSTKDVARKLVELLDGLAVDSD